MATMVQSPEPGTESPGPYPPDPLSGSVVLAGAFGLVVVIGIALAARASFRLDAWYPAKATFVFATIMAVAATFIRDHHPYPAFGPANQVTLGRALLVALIAAFIGEAAVPVVAAPIAAAAAVVTVLDGVDGWLARRSRMQSAFGARFDVETDALHVLAMSILVWQHGKAGAWVLLGALLRYAFVAAGRALPWMAGPLRSTRRGKTVAVCHMVGLNVAIAPIVPTPLSTTGVAITLMVLVWSFAVDVRRLWRQRNTDPPV